MSAVYTKTITDLKKLKEEEEEETKAKTNKKFKKATKSKISLNGSRKTNHTFTSIHKHS